MNKILAVSTADRLITAEAGVTIKTIQDAAQAHRLLYPIDFAPADTMQLGGTIATNAGGVNVCRYGMTRNVVAGLVAVTGTGAILDLSLSVMKNNTGYDLKQLFIGSEGTLGIITEATVRLVPRPAVTSTALLCVPSTAELPLIAQESHRHGVVQAMEFWDDNGMELAVNHLKRTRPAVSSPWYVLGEFEGNNGASDWARACMDSGFATSTVLADPPSMPRNVRASARDLWDIRLNIGAAVAPFIPYKNDICVPVSSLGSFLAALPRVLTEIRHGQKLVIWGHLCDGNLHINCLKPPNQTIEQFASDSQHADETIYALVRAHGGSISAEHGIGLLKKHALHFSRSEAEVDAMRAIKAIFDPDNLMNPGKIFD